MTRPKLTIYHGDGRVTRPVELKHQPDCFNCKDTEVPDYLHGMLADLCDILFDDEDRASTHGHEGVLERAREVMECVKVKQK